MATNRFGSITGKRRPISYPDPTGNAAATRVDRERAEPRDLDLDPLRQVGEAPHLAGDRGARPLTNDHCIAAIIALHIGTELDAAALLANAHTPDREVTWEPESTSQTQTEWWEKTPATFAS